MVDMGANKVGSNVKNRAALTARSIIDDLNETRFRGMLK
jgi:hypothetical protein